MPTYEKRHADGTVLERTTTIANDPNGYEAQMATLAADDASPWHLVDEHLAVGGVVSQMPAVAGESRPDSVVPVARNDDSTEV